MYVILLILKHTCYTITTPSKCC